MNMRALRVLFLAALVIPFHAQANICKHAVEVVVRQFTRAVTLGKYGSIPPLLSGLRFPKMCRQVNGSARLVLDRDLHQGSRELDLTASQLRVIQSGFGVPWL